MGFEPAKWHWAVAFLLSLMLHAGGAATAAAVLDTFQQRPAETEISIIAPPLAVAEAAPESSEKLGEASAADTILSASQPELEKLTEATGIAAAARAVATPMERMRAEAAEPEVAALAEAAAPEETLTRRQTAERLEAAPATAAESAEPERLHAETPPAAVAPSSLAEPAPRIEPEATTPPRAITAVEPDRASEALAPQATVDRPEAAPATVVDRSEPERATPEAAEALAEPEEAPAAPRAEPAAPMPQAAVPSIEPDRPTEALAARQTSERPDTAPPTVAGRAEPDLAAPAPAETLAGQGPAPLAPKAEAAQAPKPEPAKVDPARSTTLATTERPRAETAPVARLDRPPASRSNEAAPAAPTARSGSTIRPSAPAAQTVARSQGDPGRVQAVAPTAPAASGNDVRTATPERVAGLSGSQLRNSGAAAANSGTASSGPGRVATQPSVAKPLQPTTQETTLLMPTQPGSGFVPNSETDRRNERYRQVVDFVKTYDGGECFLVLPTIGDSGDVKFQALAKERARGTDFRRALAGNPELTAEVSVESLADPQCHALSFVRRAKRYPDFSLFIDLDESEVRSGAKLSGAVLNAADRPLHLLVIDDEGRVKNVDRFLEAGPDRRFSVPIVLTSGPVATRQLLIAVSATRPLALLERRADGRATNFFHQLAGAMVLTGAEIDIAVAAFSAW